MKQATQKQALIEAASILTAAKMLLNAAFTMAPTTHPSGSMVIDLMNQLDEVRASIRHEVETKNLAGVRDDCYWPHVRDAKVAIDLAIDELGRLND